MLKMALGGSILNIYLFFFSFSLFMKKEYLKLNDFPLSLNFATAFEVLLNAFLMQRH